jgi:UDP-N-acetylmuramoylalanine--D-glutamate ligase
LIREVDGVRYYDDNYSSAPGAAIAAMRSFTEPEILIMGGYDKHISFEALAEAVAKQENIKRIILIGQTRQKIAETLDAVGKNDIYELSDETSLGPIVKRVHEVAEPGDVVVMSPACASFDMFKNFSDRGDQFIRIVEGL